MSVSPNLPSDRDPDSVKHARPPQAERHLVSQFDLTEVFFERLTQDQANRLLTALNPEVAPDFINYLTEDLSCSYPNGVVSIYEQSHADADICLSYLREAKRFSDGPTLVSGYRFICKNQFTNPHATIYYEVNDQSYSLRVTWDESAREAYALHSPRWALLEDGLAALSRADVVDSIGMPRAGLAEGCKVSLGEDFVIVRLGAKFQPMAEVLSDHHLAIREDLLPFIVPGRFSDTATRLYFIHSKIFGAYDPDVSALKARGISGRAACVEKIHGHLAAGKNKVGYIESDGFILPITAETTAGELENDLCWLKKLSQLDRQSMHRKMEQDPVALSIREPSSKEIAAILCACGFTSQMSSDDEILGENIRAFLLGEKIPDEENVLQRIALELSVRIETGETLNADETEEPQIWRYFEISPPRGSPLPTLRIHSEPQVINEGSVDEVFLSTEEDIDFGDLDDAGEEEEALEPHREQPEFEVLLPTKVTLTVEWPARQHCLDTEEMRHRWRALDNIHTIIGESIVPGDLSPLPKPEDLWSSWQTSDRTILQVALGPKIRSGLAPESEALATE